MNSVNNKVFVLGSMVRCRPKDIHSFPRNDTLHRSRVYWSYYLLVKGVYQYLRCIRRVFLDPRPRALSRWPVERSYFIFIVWKWSADAHATRWIRLHSSTCICYSLSSFPAYLLRIAQHTFLQHFENVLRNKLTIIKKCISYKAPQILLLLRFFFSLRQCLLGKRKMKRINIRVDASRDARA